MQTSVDLKLLHTNPRGWVSKRAAILDVINSVQPDYVNINETQSRGENKVHIKGYNCFSKNRKEMAGGGICSAVVGSLKEQTVRVGEGGDEDEWQAVRLNHISPAITIFNVYGEQEGRASKEEVRAKWGRLLKDLEEARLRGDHCLLVGDMNKQVGNGHLDAAHSPKSPNWKSGKSGKEAKWNLAKKDGWEKYKQLTEAKSEKIKEIIENEQLDIEEVVEKFERIENKIKFEAFGKTSRKVKVPKKDVPKKDSENAEKARELIDKQSKRK